MSNLYQPPLTPGYNSTYALGNVGTSRNPFFNIANQYLPRNLHDVIRWSRYITFHSPVTSEVIRKLATYPITDFVVDSEKESTRQRYREIFKSFKLKSVLHDVGFEFFTLGNVFLSIYFPLHRTLTCPHCHTEYNAKTAEFIKFVNFKFEGVCPKCDTKGVFPHKDTRSLNLDDMNLIKWDPIHMVVNHNPITNEYAYYYKISNEIKRRVRQGDKLFVNSMPWAFIEAIKNNQDFKFENSNFFHLKNVSTGQMVEGISVPPLISQYGLVFYQATLRRANEAVAQDHMTPMRIIYPQAQTGNSDPVVAMSMKNFVNNMTGSVMRHKQDPNHVVIAPVPVGYQEVSGNGRNLLVTQELAQAEESILLSLGVSRELLTGTTNWTSSTVGLRMLDNTLQSYTGQINDLLEWIMRNITKYLGIETCPVTLLPFKLTDDDGVRNMLASLHANGKASTTSLYESYGMDYEDELVKIREDAVSDAVNQAKIQLEVERGVFLAASQMVDKFDESNDYRTALGKAQAVAEQLVNADMSVKRQVLGQMEIEDMPLYLMVSRLLEKYNEQGRAQAQAEQMQAQGLAPDGVIGNNQNPDASASQPGQQGGGQAPAQQTSEKL